MRQEVSEMNKRIVFDRQGDMDDWSIFLDFKLVGSVGMAYATNKLEFSFMVYAKECVRELDTIESVVKFLETVCDKELAAAPEEQELRILRTDTNQVGGVCLEVFIGSLLLGEFRLRTSGAHTGMIEASWLKDLGGFAGWLNPPRFATEADMLHFVRAKYGEELGL